MIPVACCCIRNSDGQILLAQKVGGLWEFPGGKQQLGETLFECAEREINEELGLTVHAVNIGKIRHITGEKPRLYELILVHCNYVSGEIRLTEHLAARWFSKEAIAGLALCEGDKVLAGELG